MKRIDTLLSAAIVVVIIGIAVLVMTKFFVFKANPDTFGIDRPDQVDLLDMEENRIRFSSLCKSDLPVFFLMFQINDCYSCIHRGLTDLNSLQSEGMNCFAVVINDSFQDLSGWLSHEAFSPFYMVRRNVFIEHFKSSYLPVLVKMADGRVVSYRYITPN